MDQPLPIDNDSSDNTLNSSENTKNVVIAVGIAFLAVGILLALSILVVGRNSEGPRLMTRLKRRFGTPTEPPSSTHPETPWLNGTDLVWNGRTFVSTPSVRARDSAITARGSVTTMGERRGRLQARGN